MLVAAGRFAQTSRRRPPTAPRWRPPSPLVRGKLGARGRQGPADPRAAERALLAGLARSLGLRADPVGLAEARRAFATERGWSASRLGAELEQAGVNEAQALRFFEELALAQLAVERGPRLLPGVDAPWLAGRFEAQLRKLQRRRAW